MQTIFFSLDRPNAKASASTLQTVRHQLRTRGIKALMVIGSYKGTVEQTFCVEVKSQVDTDYVKMLCLMFEQESMLIVNNNNQASLFYFETKEITPIGRLQAVGKDIATKLEAWTYIPHTDTYLAVKGA